MTEILAKYRTSRGAHKVRLVVIHVNQGPDQAGGARAVARYCQLDKSQRGGSVGGYHELVDNTEVIIGAHDDEVVNGAAGANEDGYHICLIGDANQTAAQWTDPFSTAAGLLAAEQARQACARMGVPAVQLVTQQVKDGLHGICGHVNVSQAYHLSDHTDPGPNFPWTQFMLAVGGPPPGPHPGPVSTSPWEGEMFAVQDTAGGIYLAGPGIWKHLNGDQWGAWSRFLPPIAAPVNDVQREWIKADCLSVVTHPAP